MPVTDADVSDYTEDGAVVLRGVFSDRIPALRRGAEHNAAQLMRSSSAQFFHDHFLQKDATTDTATPWHQDMPYYCVQGQQTVSFWIPFAARARDASLECVAGSHRLPREIRPTTWST